MSLILGLLTLAEAAFVGPPHLPTCGCHAHLPRMPLIARTQTGPVPDSLAVEPDVRETHLQNVRQLTFGGQNAEAYWNLDGTKLVYQSRQPEFPDEQIFAMNADGTGKKLLSTGLGRCTCSYFSPDERYVYFSSTHLRNQGAQKPVDMSKGYVWMVNPDFELFRREMATGRIERVLSRDGYVAETTIAPDGSFMVFTGSFDGDLEIYRANLDGSDVRRLTEEFGYDGGPFVSWCGTKIVYRRDNLETDEERRTYAELLKQHLVRPGDLDIWIMDADGSNKRRVTKLGGASFAPFLHPNGRQIIFSSNFHSANRREFDLFVVNVDGTGLKQITFTPEFDGFPMFSRDGKRLVWASNRNGSVRGETNVFVADWVDEPEKATDRLVLEPTDDVWVYSHASDQDRDPFLRCWGGENGSLPESFGDGGGSFSLIQFDLSRLDAAALRAIAEGRVASAHLILTHVDTRRENAAILSRHPLEVRGAPARVDERGWVYDDGARAFPTGNPFGVYQGAIDAIGQPFEVAVDLLQGPEDFRKALAAAGDGKFALAITSPVEPQDQAIGVFRFFSRNAPGNKGPRLVLKLR
ncbi:MAG: hypothetical protein SNJ76_12705 [Fimbriimonadaceae bacterium]